MTSQPEPFIQDRGVEAITVLSQPGPVTAAEALALAVLRGEIVAPVNDENDGGA
jgi:hypothetical protein